MKNIVVIGDLHAASHYGTFPCELDYYDPVTSYNHRYTSTPLQYFLFDEFCEIVGGKHFDVAVINGDVCCGPNKGNDGKYCTTPDLNVQVAAAVEMLRHVDADKFFFTMGTPYHSTDDRPLEQVVAEKLENITKKPCYFDYEQNLEVEGWKLHFAHAMDWKGDIIESLKKELGTNGCDLAVRSHRHEAGYIEKRGRAALCTPCWEFRSPFGFINGNYKWPDIGLTTLKVNGEEIRHTHHYVDMSDYVQYKVLD